MCISVKGGDSCYCGDTYGALGATTGCTLQCKGDGKLQCGGINKNFVYKVDGMKCTDTANIRSFRFLIFSTMAVVKLSRKV